MEHPDTLTKLYVEITTRCNLDCAMCVRRAWQEPIGEMPLREFAGLMEQVRDLSQPPIIHLSGYGEPTCHPNVLSMVALAKATGARVEMTTNGTLLSRSLIAELIDLDLDRLVVSIDGVDAAGYADIRVNGSLHQVTANLLELKRQRISRHGRHGNPQLAIAFVAMQRNVADLARLPMLATRLGAWEVLVSNVVPHSAMMEEEILYQKALQACAYRESRWVPAMSLPKLDLDGTTAAPLVGAFGSTASIRLLDASLSARNDFCQFAQRGYAVVRWDGMVSPCLSLLHDHPEYIRGRRKDVTHHSFGNVAEQPLGAIWHGQPFDEFRRRLRAFHFSPCTTCGGCERFPANYVDCIGNTFPTCGGCLWSQGFVQCA
jgi:MoaA/NifB/PqqE/SkfB family radical SAM enzyme